MRGKAFVLFQVRLPIAITQDGRWHVASSQDLDVHSQGLTVDEAKKNLMEAVQLFIESCYERGVLDNVLQALGFQPEHGYLGEGQGENGHMLDVSLPLTLARHSVQNHAC